MSWSKRPDSRPAPESGGGDSAIVEALHPANAASRRSAEAMVRCRPVWRGLVRAGDAVGADGRFLLHAGPPFKDLTEVPMPMLNAAAAAAVFEGWAPDLYSGRALVLDGSIAWYPAQDRGVATPLAEVVSPGMWLVEVRDPDRPDLRRCSPVNCGSGPVPRRGLYDPEVIDRLRLVHRQIAPRLAELVSQEPIALNPIAAQALAEGDDLHGQTGAASHAVRNVLAARMAGAADQALQGFLDDAPAFFLNLWMASCLLMMASADGVEGSTLVTGAGGNGVTFGIKLSGADRRWFPDRAQPPAGPRLPGAPPEAEVMPAIGDSAVVDATGFGAFALGFAPGLADALRDYLPEPIEQYPGRLLTMPSKELAIGSLPLGLDAARVADTGMAAPCVLAMVDAAGRHGMLGRGVAMMPVTAFRRAVVAVGEAQR